MIKWEIYHFVQSIYAGIDKVKSWIIPIALILPLWLVPVVVFILAIPYRILTIMSRFVSVIILGEGRLEQTFDDSDSDWDINLYVGYSHTFWSKLKAIFTF